MAETFLVSGEADLLCKTQGCLKLDRGVLGRSQHPKRLDSKVCSLMGELCQGKLFVQLSNPGQGVTDVQRPFHSDVASAKLSQVP